LLREFVGEAHFLGVVINLLTIEVGSRRQNRGVMVGTGRHRTILVQIELFVFCFRHRPVGGRAC
jgi:hypothetical protein